MSYDCKICNHPKADQIHQAIIGNTPLIDIPGLFNHDFNRTILHNHIKKHVGQSRAKVMEEKRIKFSTDIDWRFAVLLDKAEAGLAAAEDVLLVDGVLDFNPRAWQIQVVYDDFNHLDQNGNPIRKQATLDELTDQLADKGFHIRKTAIKGEDLRKGYREAVQVYEGILET